MPTSNSPRPCQECHPSLMCVAGSHQPRRVTLSDGFPDEWDSLDLLVPAPRLSSENLRVR
jgi:hypothetical protein